jgi:hypothetical protein
MGILSDWLDILVRIAPHCFTPNHPQLHQPIIIDDITQICAQFRNSTDRSFHNLKQRLNKRILTSCNNPSMLIKYYVCLLDSAEYVPPCKNIERLFNRNRDAFNAQELLELGILEPISVIIGNHRIQATKETIECCCGDREFCHACNGDTCNICNGIIVCRMCNNNYCERCVFNNKLCNNCYNATIKASTGYQEDDQYLGSEDELFSQNNNDKQNDSDDKKALRNSIGLNQYVLSDNIWRGLVGNGDKAWSTRMIRHIIECKLRDNIIDICKSADFQHTLQNVKWQTDTDPIHSKNGHILILDDVPKRPSDMTADEKVCNDTDHFYMLQHNISRGLMYLTCPRTIYQISNSPDHNRIDQHGNRAKVKPFSFTKTGEADLKMLHYIDKKLGNSFLIRSTDGDVIPILLLNMRNFINKDGNVDIEIWMDRSSLYDESSKATSANKSYVNIVELWRTIITYFKQKFPSIKNPIETFVLMMIITKTDYVYKFEHLEEMQSKTEKWLRVWGISDHPDMEFEYEPDAVNITPAKSRKPKRPDGVVTPKILWSLLENRENWFIDFFTDHHIITSSVPLKNERFQLQTLKIDQNRLFELVMLLYEKRLKAITNFSVLTKIFQNKRGIYNSTKDVHFDDLKDFVDKHNNSNPIKQVKIEIPSTYYAKENIKRVQYQLEYWTNGFLPSWEPGSCCLQNSQGDSIYGWTMVAIPNDHKPNIENLAFFYGNNTLHACVMKYKNVKK